MLSKKAFVDGTGKLEGEFKNKGFEMTTKRAAEWYRHFENMTDDEFNKRVDYVLENCTYTPCMADIFKADIGRHSNLSREEIEKLIL